MVQTQQVVQQQTSAASLLTPTQQLRPAVQTTSAGNTKYAVTPQVVQQGWHDFFLYVLIINYS